MSENKTTEQGIEDPLCLLMAEGFSCEWHAHGMNIELRFRSSDRIYHLIEDAHGVVQCSSGFDRSIEKATEALAVLARRGGYAFAE